MIDTLPATAPVDMVMPPLAQQWMIYLNWIPVVIILVLALRHWKTRGSPIGVLFLLGGALTTLNEPVVDILGKCWFPALGSQVLFTAWGVSIPTYMVLVYAWYVGGQAFLAYRLYEKGITVKGVFGLYATLAAVNVVLEVPGLQVPMYSYYGNQPLVVFGFPLWWTFCNALMPLMMAGIVFRLEPVLRGLRQLLVIPLTWMVAAATNGLVAAPVWLALNSGGGLGLAHGAALLSLGMGIMVCYGVSLMVAIDAPLLPNAHGRQHHP